MARAAVVKGVFLKPSVSQNGRAYTAKNIAAAVSRMKESLNSSDGLPLTMATSHGAASSDDALATIGRITAVDQLPDGSATFEADIADTAAGRDIAALVVPDSSGRQFIKGISIRGRWMTDPYEVKTESGETATTADDLSVLGIDFTGSPGVNGAQITDASLAESLASLETALQDPSVIFESAPDAEFIDEANKEPYGAVTYADPGYQKDKKKRYPINTAAHVRAAWSYINQAKNGSAYSPAQLKRIKSKIKSAAKKFNIDIASESQQLADELTEVLEAYASVCYDNGAASINISGCTDDAGKLAPLGARLAYAAAVALNAVDPDADGDVDLVMPDGARDSSSSSMEAAPDDDQMEGQIEGDAAVTNCTHCAEPLEDTAMYCPMCGQPIQQAESNDLPSNPENQEGTVPDEITPTAEAAAPAAEAAPAAAPVAEAAPAAPAAAPAAPAAEVAAAVTEALAPSLNAIATALTALAPAAPVAEAAAPAPVAEAAPEAAPVAEAAPATFTAADMLEVAAKAKEEALQEAVAAFRSGPGHRKGLVSDRQTVHSASDLSEGGLDPRVLAEMSNQDFLKTSAEVWESQPYKFAKGKLPAAV